MNEVSKTIENQKSGKSVQVDSKIFEIIQKELGDFEIVL